MNISMKFCRNFPFSFLNKRTASGCPRLTVGCLIEDKMSMSKKGHNSEINAFWIVSLDSLDRSLDSYYIL